MKSLIVVGFLMLSNLAHCHMEMSSPAPIKSRFNSFYNWKNIDYNYNDPLTHGGYPCKGYHLNEPRLSVANYTVGETQTIKLSGNTPHNGGSCQLSLSYDGGKTFTVIKSIIGGCPVQREYDFVIPQTAPAGQTLFAWTWIANEGNRDFYMNCAWVDIINNKTSTISAQDEALTAKKASQFFAEPLMFKAQMEGDCVVEEGYDYIFPDPGPDIEYGSTHGRLTTKCLYGKAQVLENNKANNGNTSQTHISETSSYNSNFPSQKSESVLQFQGVDRAKFPNNSRNFLSADNTAILTKSELHDSTRRYSAITVVSTFTTISTVFYRLEPPASTTQATSAQTSPAPVPTKSDREVKEIASNKQNFSTIRNIQQSTDSFGHPNIPYYGSSNDYPVLKNGRVVEELVGHGMGSHNQLAKNTESFDNFEEEEEESDESDDDASQTPDNDMADEDRARISPPRPLPPSYDWNEGEYPKMIPPYRYPYDHSQAQRPAYPPYRPPPPPPLPSPPPLPPQRPPSQRPRPPRPPPRPHLPPRYPSPGGSFPLGPPRNEHIEGRPIYRAPSYRGRRPQHNI